MTISLIDADNMYLPSKLTKNKRAVRYFTKGIFKANKKTINLFLGVICFGMSSTLISFDGEYYKYHGGG